jgi:hypothetical protein
MAPGKRNGATRRAVYIVPRPPITLAEGSGPFDLLGAPGTPAAHAPRLKPALLLTAWLTLFPIAWLALVSLIAPGLLHF